MSTNCYAGDIVYYKYINFWFPSKWRVNICSRCKCVEDSVMAGIQGTIFFFPVFSTLFSKRADYSYNCVGWLCGNQWELYLSGGFTEGS